MVKLSPQARAEVPTNNVALGSFYAHRIGYLKKDFNMVLGSIQAFALLQCLQVQSQPWPHRFKPDLLPGSWVWNPHWV